MTRIIRIDTDKTICENQLHPCHSCSLFYKIASYLLLIFFVLNACNNSPKEPEKDAVAKVYDRYLYRSDLKGIVPKAASYRDSINIVKNYIDSWIRQNILLHKAEQNLLKDSIQTKIEKQIDDYRNSLITYAYENELIHQKLDTVVADEEIENYYKNHQNNFELKDNIIKVLYLKLNKKSPKLDKVKLWYKSENPKDKKMLEDYCHEYAMNFFLDDNTWLLFDDLLKEIPIKTYDKEQFLHNNRFIETQDSSSIYLVNIKGFRIKDSISPLSFEKDNIRNIILNQRKLKLIQEMEKQTYNDALEKNEFVVY